MISRGSIHQWALRAGCWAVLIVSQSRGVLASFEADPPPDVRAIPSTSAGVPALTTSFEVVAGQASFDLPAGSPDSPALVIVSCLAQTGGPFPITLTARSIHEPARPWLAGPRPIVRLPIVDLAPRVSIPPPTTRLPATERTFHLMTQSGLPTAASSYRAIPSRLRAVGRRVQIYVDAADLANVETATLRDLVESFDNRVWPAVAERFGPATDVDGDGRFTILLTRWLSRLAEGQIRVDGFVRGADLDRRQPAPFGNRADMMYLNANLMSGPQLRTVVAHEYAHAVTFSRKVLDADPQGPLDSSAEEEGWLDEAIAHLVEDELGFSRTNLDYRVSAFLSQPERYRLVVDDYFTADLFRSHGNRGATYLFLRWCVDRFGPRLLDVLVRSPRRGVGNLEAATGMPFAELFRRWTIAVYCSGLDPKSAEAGQYRSINLRGELEDWILAGPRAATLGDGDPAHVYSAEGTSTHFVLIRKQPAGPTRVEVTGPPQAELQVTVVALPPGSAPPELIIRPMTDADGSVRVRAEVVEAGGTAVRLGALSWERLVPVADPHAPGFRRDGLDMLGIAAAFGSSAVPAHGALRSRPIILPGVRSADGPLVFKAVGLDARGRKLAAWAVVEPSTRADDMAWEDDAP